MAKVNRNAPCPCGSGTKYKKCCLGKVSQTAHQPVPLPPLGTAPVLQRQRNGQEQQAATTKEQWVQEGYELMMEGNSASCCDVWWNVWKLTHLRLQPTMRTVDSAEALFGCAPCLFDWVQDFAQELGNAAHREAQYATWGIHLCERILAQFPDESCDLFQINFRADLGQFYFLAGKDGDGERVLSALISDKPDCAAGYTRLSDLLASRAKDKQSPDDLERAKHLLEQALARPVKDAENYDVARRLQQLHDSPLSPAQSSEQLTPPPAVC